MFGENMQFFSAKRELYDPGSINMTYLAMLEIT